MTWRVLMATTLLAVSTAGAQSVADHIARGDAEYAQFQPSDALAHYEAAIAADSTSYEALWKAARSEVDLAEAEPNEGRRMQLSRAAETHARRAIALNPRDAEAHFHLARALGRRALSVGVRERIKLATEIRAEALEALKYDPKHPGALHVLSVWNAEVMRLNGMSRFIAKNVLGGRVFGEASWEKAVSYMEQALAVDPERIVHHLDLAKIYADIGNMAKAREHLAVAVDGKRMDYSDPAYKREAQTLLARLDKRD